MRTEARLEELTVSVREILKLLRILLEKESVNTNADVTLPNPANSVEEFDAFNKKLEDKQCRNKSVSKPYLNLHVPNYSSYTITDIFRTTVCTVFFLTRK